MESKFNPFHVAQQQLDTAAERLGLDEATHELLRWPMHEIKITLPVKMDDGATRVFHAFEFNTTRRGGLQKAAFDGTRTKPSTRSAPSPHG